MAETTVAPSDLAPVERPMPVGWRFHPTEQELVGHYLRRKLRAGDLSIQDTIPEIGLCKYEPWEFLDRAASASAAKFDESQCFFFSPRDHKYSNRTRSNRATLRGFWKVTGRDSKITSKDTNKVIGTKKILIYHESRVPHEIKTNWVIHEYHDAKLSHNQEHYFLNRSSMVQIPSQSNEAIDSMIQIPFGSNKAIDSIIQTAPQSNEAIDSMIQIPFRSIEAIDSMIQTANEAIDSMIQTAPQSYEAIDSMIQTALQSNEAIDSMIQISFGSNEAIDSMIQIAPQSNETIASMIQMPLGSNDPID
ncbi:hypothetical protein K1719_028701 [Acacia pycnantha]|nr:hypothetical protein K1719_028701 [Acacia pycnantha]